MKVLWLCNIMLPVIARQLHLEVSNKEGWLSGLAEAVLDGTVKAGESVAVGVKDGELWFTVEEALVGSKAE